jgi:hypothetical protein
MKMKIVLFSNLALLALCGFALAPRANADAVLSVSAPSSVSLGQSFALDVNIANAADLYAFQFDLRFDASVLSLTGISEGSFLPGAGATFFIPGAIDNTAGLASASADTLLAAVSGANGAGALVVFDFTAIGSGISDIALFNLFMLDSNLSLLNGTAGTGSVEVDGAVATPEPSVALLLAIALVGLFLLRWLFGRNSLLHPSFKPLLGPFSQKVETR